MEWIKIVSRMSLVLALLGWFAVPSPAEADFALSGEDLAGLHADSVTQTASAGSSLLSGAADVIVALFLLLFLFGAVASLFGEEPKSDKQATHGDIVAMVLGISVAWCWFYLFPIRSLAAHSGGAFIAGVFNVALGKYLDTKQARRRPVRSVLALLLSFAALAGSVALVSFWGPLQRNEFLARHTWLLAPRSVYVIQYALWGGTALALLLHGVQLVKAATAQRWRGRLSKGLVLLSPLALAGGVASGWAAERAGLGMIIAVVAGCFAAETLYSVLLSPLLAPYRWAQILVYILPRALLPSPLFVGMAILLPNDRIWTAPATYLALLVLELGWRWMLSRLAPILRLKAQVARAQQWSSAAGVLERTRALQKALLEHWKSTLSQAESKRTSGQIEAARKRYTRVIAGLGDVPRKGSEERRLLGSAHMGLGKLLWAKDQKTSLSEFRLAQELGVIDAEVYRRVAPTWARANRADGEAVQAYMSYVEAGLGRAMPEDDAAVLGRLMAICRIDEDMQGPALAEAMKKNERVVRAAGNVDWAHMHLGIGFLTQGKPLEALPHLERVQVLQPGWKEVFYHQGRGYLLDGHADKALNALRQARAALPNHAGTAHLLGKVQLDELLAGNPEPDLERPYLRRRWAEAVQHLETASVVAARPIPAIYFFELARAYSLLPAQREEAVRALREAVAADPTQELYHWKLGLELKKLGRLDEAKQAVADALALDPACAQAHVLMGEIALARGEPAQSRAHFEQALKALPMDKTIAAGLGQALYQLGEYAEAVALLSGEEVATADSLFCLARAHAHLDQFDEAARCLTRRLEQFGENADARYYLGCAWAHLDDYPKALAHLDQALANRPGQADAWVQRGHVLLQMDQEQDAHDSYLKALTTDPSCVAAHHALGRFYQARRQWAEAAQHYGQAVDLAPTHAPSRRALGLICERKGEAERAIAHYEAALATDEPWAWVHCRLGVHYSSQPGHESESVQHLERARELGHESDHLTFHLGLAYLQQGAYARAADEWETLLREHPNDARLQTNLAATHYLWGQQAFAAAEYGQAIDHWELFRARFDRNRKIQVDLAEAYFRWAVTKMQDEKQGTGVRQALETAIELQGGGGTAGQRFHLGLAHLHADGSEEPLGRAVELFAGITEAEPEFVQSRYYLGLALWDRYLHGGENGDLQRAAASLQQAAAENGGPGPGLARLLLALTLTAAGQHEEAGQQLVEAWPTLADQGDDAQTADVARLLAWNLEQASGRDAAEVALTGLRSVHDHPALDRSLAALAVEGGRMQEAVGLLEEALGQMASREDKSTRDMLRHLLCHQAAIQGRSGDWLGAAQLLRQAVNL
jgi:tetratricopeptide (TPR) repeat protein